MITPRARPQPALGQGFPPSARSACRAALLCLEEGATSRPYRTITSEAVGSWWKSEWISAAALRKCRSSGPGAWGRLAAGREEGVGVKAHAVEERAPTHRAGRGCGPVPQPLMPTDQRLAGTLSPGVTSVESGSRLRHAQPRTVTKPGAPSTPRIRGVTSRRRPGLPRTAGVSPFPKAGLSWREVGHCLGGCWKHQNELEQCVHGAFCVPLASPSIQGSSL